MRRLTSKLPRLRASGFRGLAGVLVIGALAPAVLALAWVMARSVSSPLLTDAPATPVLIPVAKSQRDQASPVKVTVVFAGPREAKAAGSGLVTGVSVQIGQRLSPGAPVVTVNDRVRLAFAATAPLWRDLGLGMRGADVSRVQEFLAALGHAPGSTNGTVTQGTLTGIRALNQTLGYGSTDATLHRESLVWIGPEPFTVTEIVARPGDVIADGATLLRGPEQPTAITIAEPEIFTPAGKKYVMSVGTAQVPYAVGSLRITDPQSVTSVVEALRGQSEGGGTLRLASPETVGTLPVAAIITGAGGEMCVFESVSGPPIAIEPLGGTLSAADVSESWIGRTVLVNPRDVRQDLSCG